jgi:hypothetical protein
MNLKELADKLEALNVDAFALLRDMETMSTSASPPVWCSCSAVICFARSLWAPRTRLTFRS